MLEYKINEYITLKLENNKTVIYLNGEKFLTCTYLLLNIPVDNLNNYDEIESIDQVSDRNEHNNNVTVKIAPKVEFWGHCSNLQAWVENDYDTRIIDSRLGFPLLLRLKDLGDIKAKKRFKEEFTKRFESGWLPTIEYLWREVYLKHFDEEERQILLEDIKKGIMKALNDKNVIRKVLLQGGYLYLLNDEEKKGIAEVESLREEGLKILEKQREFRTNEDVTTLKRGFLEPHNFEEYDKKWKKRLESKPRKLSLEKTVKYLILKGYFGALSAEDVRSHPKFQQLEILFLNKFRSPFTLKALPDTIGYLRALKELRIWGYDLTELPESLFELKNLQLLGLSENKLKTISKSIGKLTKLTSLSLYRNQLESLPETIGNLKDLVWFNLKTNKLTSLPRSFLNLSSLKGLALGGNNFKKIPTSIFHLTKLERLELNNLELNSLPESIGKLVNLKELDLSWNNLTLLPKSIKYLTSLESLNLSFNSTGDIKGYSIHRGPIFQRLEKEGFIK